MLEVLDLDDPSPVIVTELLESESLRDVLALRGMLANRPLADLAVQVVSPWVRREAIRSTA